MSLDLVVSVSVNFHWLSGLQFSLDGVVGRPVDGYGLDPAMLSDYFVFSSCGSPNTPGLLLINWQQVVLQSCGSIGFSVT